MISPKPTPHFDLNPTGNLWDRLRAAYFLIKYPTEFADAIISEFMARISTRIQAQLAEIIHQPDPGVDATVSPEMAIAADHAREEATNG